MLTFIYHVAAGNLVLLSTDLLRYPIAILFTLQLFELSVHRCYRLISLAGGGLGILLSELPHLIPLSAQNRHLQHTDCTPNDLLLRLSIISRHSLIVDVQENLGPS